jgi:predicted site-specific integrase-resolvase
MDSRTVMDPRAAAEYLGIARQTLARWRVEGRTGPPWYKLGGLVRYDCRELETWLRANRRPAADNEELAEQHSRKRARTATATK